MANGIDPTVPALIQQAGALQAQQAGVPLSILADALTGMEKTFKELDRRQEKVDDATMKLIEMKARFPNLDVAIDPQTNRPTISFLPPPPIPEGFVPTRTIRDGTVFEPPPPELTAPEIPPGFRVSRISPQGVTLEPIEDQQPLTKEDALAFGATPEQADAITKLRPSEQRQLLSNILSERGRSERAAQSRSQLEEFRREANRIRQEALDLRKVESRQKRLERATKLRSQIASLQGDPLFRFTPDFLRDQFFIDTVRMIEGLQTELSEIESGAPAPSQESPPARQEQGGSLQDRLKRIPKVE